MESTSNHNSILYDIDGELDDSQIQQLKQAFDQLFVDYSNIFDGISDNYQFVRYYGWLCKCNQVLDVVQRTDKKIFSENLRLLSAYVALLPQNPFDSTSRIQARELCDRFYSITHSYPIESTLKKLWKPSSFLKKSLTPTEMNIIYFKAYYECRLARNDLKVYLGELSQLYKNLNKVEDVGIILESLELVMSSKYFYENKNYLSYWIQVIMKMLFDSVYNYGIKCQIIEILKKIIISLKTKDENIRKNVFTLIEKNTYNLIENILIRRKNHHIKSVDDHFFNYTFQYVFPLIQSHITDILIYSYFMKSKNVEYFSTYLLELEHLLASYSSINRIIEIFNLALNFLKLCGCDNVEKYFVQYTVSLCEIGIKTNDVNTIGYYQQVYKFMKKLVADKINDTSKIFIINEFFNRLKSLDYINRTDQKIHTFKYSNKEKSGGKITLFIYQSYLCWKKYFLIFLCVCAQHFGPIGKQIFVKPLSNDQGNILIDEIIHWLSCDIHDIIFYVIIALKYIVEYNPLLLTYTLNKCISKYLEFNFTLSNKTPGHLYAIASMVAIASNSQYGVPHQVIRKVFDIIMILAEQTSNHNSSIDDTVLMDCKRIIWLTISGICMLGSQIVQHFNRDIFNYFSMTYDIRIFNGYANISDLDYCDVTYSLIAIKNYAKFCPQLIDDMVAKKLNKYLHTALDFIRSYYYNHYYNYSFDNNKKQNEASNIHKKFESTVCSSNLDLIFSIFFNLLLELKDIFILHGIDLYVNAGKICFRILSSYNTPSSLIYEPQSIYNQIHHCPIYPIHQRIANNPFKFYQEINNDSNNYNDYFLSLFPVIIEPIDQVEKIMNYGLPISTITIDSVIQFLGNIMCFLPNEDIIMFSGMICEHTQKSKSNYSSLQEYFNTQSNCLLVYIIYLKECLKIRKYIDDEDYTIMIYDCICFWKSLNSPLIQCLVSEVVGLYFAVTRNITLAVKTLVSDYRVAVSNHDEQLVAGSILSIANIHYNCKHDDIDSYLDTNIKLILSFSNTSISWIIQHWSRYALYLVLPHIKSLPQNLIEFLILNISKAIMNTCGSYIHNIYDLSRCLSSMIEFGLGMNVFSYNELAMIEMCLRMLKSSSNDFITSEYFHISRFYQLYKRSLKKDYSDNGSSLDEKNDKFLGYSTIKLDHCFYHQESQYYTNNTNCIDFTTNIIKLIQSPIENLLPFNNDQYIFDPNYMIYTCFKYLTKNHPHICMINATNLLKQLTQLYPHKVYQLIPTIKNVMTYLEHPMYVITQGLEGYLFGLLDVLHDCETAIKNIKISIKSLINYALKSKIISFHKWFSVLQKVISPPTTNITVSVCHAAASQLVIYDTSEKDENTYQTNVIMPYWSTRLYALTLLDEILVWCSDEHCKLEDPDCSYHKRIEIFEHLSEIMKISLIASLSKNDGIRLEGLKIISNIINAFGSVTDPRFPNQLFLEQYILQINSSLKVALKQKADPNSTLYACKIVSSWITIKIKQNQYTGCDDMYELIDSALDQFQNSGASLNHTIHGEAAYTTRILSLVECFANIYNNTCGYYQKYQHLIAIQSNFPVCHTNLINQHLKCIGICCLTVIIDWCKIPTIMDAKNVDVLASTFFFKHIISKNFNNFVVNYLPNTLLMSVLWLKSNFYEVSSVIKGCTFGLPHTLSDADIWNYLFAMICFVLVDICYNTSFIFNKNLIYVIDTLNQLLYVFFIENSTCISEKNDILYEILDVIFRLILGTTQGDIYPSILATVATILDITQRLDKSNDTLAQGKFLPKVTTIIIYVLKNLSYENTLPINLKKNIKYIFLPNISFSQYSDDIMLMISIVEILVKCCSIVTDTISVDGSTSTHYMNLYVYMITQLMGMICCGLDNIVNISIYESQIWEINDLLMQSLYQYDPKFVLQYLFILLSNFQNSGSSLANSFHIKLKLAINCSTIVEKCDQDMIIVPQFVNIVDSFVSRVLDFTKYHEYLLEVVLKAIKSSIYNNTIQLLAYLLLEYNINKLNDSIVNVGNSSDSIINENHFNYFKIIYKIFHAIYSVDKKRYDIENTANYILSFSVPFLLYILECNSIKDDIRSEILITLQSLGNDFSSHFKEYMLKNSNLKKMLQDKLIERSKNNINKPSDCSNVIKPLAKQFKQLSMDFSHFD